VTFVREPLQRFVSGFAEAAWRERVDAACGRRARSLCAAALRDPACPPRRTRPSCAHVPHSSQVRASTDSYAEHHISRLLDALPPWNASKAHGLHTYPMVGLHNAGWKIAFWGHVEQLETSWEALRSLGRERRRGLARREGAAAPQEPFSRLPPFSMLDHRLGTHVSSSDPTQHRTGLVRTLRRSPRLRAALCRLLQPDYECFGYDLAACHAAPLVHGRSDVAPTTPVPVDPLLPVHPLLLRSVRHGNGSSASNWSKYGDELTFLDDAEGDASALLRLIEAVRQAAWAREARARTAQREEHSRQARRMLPVVVPASLLCIMLGWQAGAWEERCKKRPHKAKARTASVPRPRQHASAANSARASRT
jgi:hypothetical protein